MNLDDGNAVEHDTELSLEEIAGEAFDELEAPEVEEVVEEVPETKEVEEVEPEKAEEPVEEEKPEETPAFPDAPEHWNASLKDAYAKFKDMGEDGLSAANAMQDAHSNMYKDYQKDKQALKDTEQFQNLLAEKIAPFQQTIQKYGNNLPDLVSKLLSIEQDLQNDFNGTIATLAPLYNAKLESQEDAPYIDPEIKKHEETINSLQQQIQQLTGHFQQNQQAQQDTILNSKIQEFTTAANEDGTLKHPHFNDEQVQNYMKIYGDNAARTGQVITPESAYDLACKTLGKDAPKVNTRKLVTPPKRIRSSAKVEHKPNLSFEDLAKEAYDELS